jgi:DNA-binding response OmpR family regulator
MPKRILITEDDPDILEILNVIFIDEGLDVVLSATGSEIDQIDDIKPDIVLLDIRLKNSGHNGIVICSQQKNRPEKKLPVILLSEEKDLEVISRLWGANAYVKKPFDVDVLAKEVLDLII